MPIGVSTSVSPAALTAPQRRIPLPGGDSDMWEEFDLSSSMTSGLYCVLLKVAVCPNGMED